MVFYFAIASNHTDKNMRWLIKYFVLDVAQNEINELSRNKDEMKDERY